MDRERSIVTAFDEVGIVKDHRTGEHIEIKGNDKIYKAVLDLSKYGKITFSREQIFKSTHYYFHFFKPVETLRQLYNLGDEMLVLCCIGSINYFKSRTKDFIDYLLATKAEYKNRLDKITCILIDDNDDIVNIIKEDRNANPDSRLIVPFSYSELINGISESELQNRFRDFLFERDLFGIASPLNNDTYFYGQDRMNLISSLYGKYKQGEQAGLFGLRRIGKTSVLNLLQIRIEQDGGAAVYFDCSQYHHQRWNSFLHQIVVEIEKKYKKVQTEDGNTRIPKEFSLPKSASRYTEAKAAKSFEEDISSLSEVLGTRILLIFDEVENISYTTSPSENWKTGNDALFFWQSLRSIIQTNNTLFSFIIAGVNPKCVELSQINGCDNPIFGMLRPQYVTLFNLKDVKNMVSGIGGHSGLYFDEEIYSRLVEDYGGHPFLIRQVCSRINTDLLEKGEERPYTVSKYSYEKNAENYRLEMAGVIEQILGVLETYYPEEFEMLKRLALDGRTAFRKRLGGRENAIVHLLGYCLIERAEDDYFVRIKSIEDYLKNKYYYEKTATTQDQIREEVRSRRERIEMILRDIIFHNMQSQYGKKSKERLMAYISGTNDQTQLKRMRDVPFSQALKELYFNQLKFIMAKDWKMYQNIFPDKVKFEQFFDVINSNRIDAHAKDIDEEDYAVLQIAFKFFEKALSDFF